MRRRGTGVQRSSSAGHRFGHQLVTQTRGFLGQRLHQPLLIGRLVPLLALTHILLAIFQQTINALRNLPRRRHDRFAAARPRLNAAVERPQRILGVMAALRRHPQRPRHAVGASPDPPLENLAAAAAVLWAQPQPTDEILLVGKGAQVRAQLAQDHQRRRLADAFDLRQVHAAHAEQQHPRSETHLIFLRLAFAQARRQRPAVALVLERKQARLDLPLALTQLLLVELVQMQRLLQSKQQLRPPVAVQRTGDRRFTRFAQLVTMLRQLQRITLATHDVLECEGQIEACLLALKDKSDGRPLPPSLRKRKPEKNQVRFGARALLFRMSGVDLTQIEGISETTALVILSELGTDLSAFAHEKNFVSWLGLCPQHRGSGGKIFKRRIRRGANRVARALRMAAQGCHHAKNALGAFYRRIQARAGGPKAIVATARKIAERVYRLLKYGQEYVRQSEQGYEAAYQQRLMKSLAKKAASLGYKLVPETMAG